MFPDLLHRGRHWRRLLRVQREADPDASGQPLLHHLLHLAELHLQRDRTLHHAHHPHHFDAHQVEADHVGE